MAMVRTLIPAQTLTRDAALVIGGATITALSAQLAIPTLPVPITMQTLAVCLCGITLGARRGMAAQATYLLAGLAGAPVFANGSFGPHVLAGPTGGYLIGFVLAAGLLGLLAEHGWDRKFAPCLAAMLLGHLAILTLGTGWLSLSIGLSAAVAGGFMPFLIGSLAKSVAAMLALPAAWKFTKPD